MMVSMVIDEELLAKEKIISTHNLGPKDYQYSTINGKKYMGIKHYSQWCLDCCELITDATINSNLSALKECSKLPPRLRGM